MAALFAGAAPTLRDRLSGGASPRHGLSRHFDRVRLSRAYESASPRDGWKPRRPGASANADHTADAAAIRTKARALVQNVPYVAAGLEALVANTIGTGITTYATGADAVRFNALWDEWCKVCDADGRLDWAGIQAMAYRAMEQDGEVLLRLRPRLASDGLPIPLQVQLLEIDWLDSARQQGAAGSNSIVNGIEYDMLGRPAAYWLWDDHPGSTGPRLRGGAKGQSRRVPAESIVHLFNPERPGQGRGFSRLAPIIPRVRDLQLLEDAELARKNLEARLGVLVSGDASALAQPTQYGAEIDTAGAARTGDLGELSSGGITQLPPGMNITTVAPNPSPGHVENVKHHLHIIAVGMGVTYEMMTGDMREVNFSSSRVRQSDFRRQVEARQWLCLIPRLIVPVWRAANDAAVLARRIARPAYACDHNTPKWDYVNPQQDANSELTLIGAGLLTISESLRRRGYKPDTVFAELKADFDKLRANGVLEVLLAMQGKTDPQIAADQAAQAAQDAQRRASRAG
jgi:lambda family phage portal protein